jgi:hypothetical protein
MAKRLIPLLDRVLVEKLKPVNKSIGGVLLPDTATHKVKPSQALHKLSSTSFWMVSYLPAVVSVWHSYIEITKIASKMA